MKPEKISNNDSSRAYKKFLKKVARRRRRILEKTLMGYCPKKTEYFGWSM